MENIYIQDRQTYKATSRQYTDEGFLKVPGRVAKTGTQKYLRRELGLDGDPNDTVIVYRPETEVFNDTSLNSFRATDVTFIHPKELVNAENFKNVTVGVVDGPGRKDGDFVICDLVIKDKAAIQQVESGIAELSAGYTADYFEEKGIAPDGTEYDYVQKNIRINHVAIVPVARAGHQARIFDNQPKGTTMHKVTLDSGRTVEIQDQAAAMLISDAIARMAKEVTDSKADLSKAQATIDAQKAKMDEMEKEDDEEVIREKVEKVAKTKDAAFKVAGDGFTCDSVNPIEIMRSALAVARPSVAWADKDEHYVSAAFDMAIEFSKEKPQHTAAAQLQQFAKDAAQGAPNAQPTQDAYTAYAERMRTSTRQEK